MRTFAWAVLAAVVGYGSGGIVGLLGFWLFAADLPEGGTGNARHGYVWAAVGGLTGAGLAVALVAAVWLRRRRDPS